jgi:hypothetical protein
MTRLRFLASFALSSSLFLAASGCESGKEVAAVGSATAVRDAQDRVAIAVTLRCAIVYGMGRSSGCDADDSDVCVDADWYDATTDTKLEHSLFHARACAYQSSITGAKMQVVSEGAIPKSPAMTIRLHTEPQLDSRDGTPTPVTIPSP